MEATQNDYILATCPRCGVIAVPGRTSCHMCYALLDPPLPTATANEVVTHEPPLTDTAAATSCTPTPIYTEANGQYDISEQLPALQHETTTDNVIQSEADHSNTINESTLPDFLRYDAVRQYYRKHRIRKIFSRIRLKYLAHWLLAGFVITLGYAAWRYAPKPLTDEQQARATATAFATAINTHDYQWVYDHTLWKEHFQAAFKSNSDIRRFCQQPGRFDSVKLRNLAELWQMKHTVVDGGKHIGRNSISYTFKDASDPRLNHRFTVTRTPSSRWLWDISYDYRLAPSDIPLLNHIIVRSRLQK